MTRGRTRAALLARLERLERRAIPPSSNRIKLRFGHLRRLPESYVGERHIIIAKHLPSQGGQEWVEFEEVPGPDPNPHLPGHREECIDIAFVTRFSSEEPL